MLEQSSLWPAHGVEEWRPVLGFENRYEVSDLGRVRSLMYRRGGRDRVRAVPIVLRSKYTRSGYYSVSLAPRRRIRSVHTLVLEAFVGPRPVGKECAHLNGVRTDNRPANLAWKTHRENERDKIAHGTLLTGDRSTARTHIASRQRGDRHPFRMRPELAELSRGERNKNAKLTTAHVLAIRAAVAAGEPQRRVAARYGVAQGIVWGIAHRRGWRHVPEASP